MPVGRCGWRTVRLSDKMGSTRVIFRLVSFDRQALVPTLAIFGSAILGCSLTLAAIGGPHMVRSQLLREAGRQPIPSERVAGPGEASAWWWEVPVGDRVLTWVFVAQNGKELVPPPGLEELPGVGETLGSPAVEDLVASGSWVGEVIPRLDGTVSADGLERPDELVLWTGISRMGLEYPGVALTGFGAPPFLPEYFSHLYRPLYFALAALLVGVPLVTIVGVGSRAAERVRRDRSRTLELVGAPSWVAKLCGGVEVAVPAEMGAALGAGLYRWLPRWAEEAGWAFRQDLVLSPGTLLAVSGGVVLVMVTVAWFALAAGDGARTAVRQVSTWFSLVLALSVVVGMVMFRVIEGRALRAVVWFGTVLAIGGLLFLASTRLVEKMASVFAPQLKAPVWRAAMRMLEDRPRVVTEISLLLAMLTVTIVGTGPLAGAFFDQTTEADRYQRIRESTPAVVAYSELMPGQVLQLDSVRGVIPVVAFPDGESAMLATCNEVRSLLRAFEVPCDDLVNWVIANDYTKLDGSSNDQETDLPVVWLEDPVMEDSIRRIVDPAVAGSDYVIEGSMVGLDSSQSGIDRFKLEMVAAFPDAPPPRVALDDRIIGLRRLAFIPVFMIVVGVIGLLASALGGVLMLVPLAEDRRRLQNSWRMIGSPDRFLWGTQFLFYWLPGVVTIGAGGSLTYVVVSWFASIVGLPSGQSANRYVSVIPVTMLLSAVVALGGAWMTNWVPESEERRG